MEICLVTGEDLLMYPDKPTDKGKQAFRIPPLTPFNNKMNLRLNINAGELTYFQHYNGSFVTGANKSWRTITVVNHQPLAFYI